MDATKEILSDALVKIFNQILFNEERYLHSHIPSNVTLRGVHVLEAINDLTKQGDASMGNIADKLNITAGTLTTLLKNLEKQGYTTKKQSSSDKRKYYITLTPAAKKVLKVHENYHKNMVDIITSNLSTKEAASLVDLLGKIKYYFSN